MKNNAFFYILFFMISFLMILACEKADLQKVSSSKEIEDRGGCVDDCEDCDPVEDCCCSVTLLSNLTDVDLQFCGTSSPCLSTVACEAGSVGACSDIVSSFIEDISLPSQFSTKMFCVPKNSIFGIISTSQTAQVRLTCQVGQVSPQTVTITVGAPGAKPYWETITDCILSACF